MAGGVIIKGTGASKEKAAHWTCVYYLWGQRPGVWHCFFVEIYLG